MACSANNICIISSHMSFQQPGESSRYLSYCCKATLPLQYALNISYTPHSKQTIFEFLMEILNGDVCHLEELCF